MNIHWRIERDGVPGWVSGMTPGESPESVVSHLEHLLGIRADVIYDDPADHPDVLTLSWFNHDEQCEYREEYSLDLGSYR